MLGTHESKTSVSKFVWVLPDFVFLELDENTSPGQVTHLFWLSKCKISAHPGSAFPLSLK